MSGGSLGYLYCKEPEDLFNRLDVLLDAETYLIQHGYEDIASDVRRLIEYIQTARIRIGVLHKNLADVFHAIEWHLSADYGEDTAKRVFEEYRNK